MEEYGRVSTWGGYIVRGIEDRCLGKSHDFEDEDQMRLAKVFAASCNRCVGVALRCKMSPSQATEDVLRSNHQRRKPVQLDIVWMSVGNILIIAFEAECVRACASERLSGDSYYMSAEVSHGFAFSMKATASIAVETYSTHQKEPEMFHVVELSTLERRQA